MGVSVGARVFVGVNVLVGVFVGVNVLVGVLVFVGAGVLVGVAVGKAPDPIKLKASIPLPLCPQVLPSKYNTEE